MEKTTIEILLFDKLIDYLKYKNADLSKYEWRENAFGYVTSEYIIKECTNIPNSKRFELRTNDNFNPDGRLYPYSRVFLWYYTDAKEEDRCYLNQYAVFDKLFFLFKRKDELTFSPVSYFETYDEAENMYRELKMEK